MLLRTRATRSGFTRGSSFSTRETVAVETPAALATSLIVVMWRPSSRVRPPLDIHGIQSVALSNRLHNGASGDGVEASEIASYGHASRTSGRLMVSRVRKIDYLR